MKQTTSIPKSIDYSHTPINTRLIRLWDSFGFCKYFPHSCPFLCFMRSTIRRQGQNINYSQISSIGYSAYIRPFFGVFIKTRNFRALDDKYAIQTAKNVQNVCVCLKDSERGNKIGKIRWENRKRKHEKDLKMLVERMFLTVFQCDCVFSLINSSNINKSLLCLR